MTAITLKPADPAPDSEDCRAVWEWRNDPVTRQMSRTTELIPWESHKRWYEKFARSPQTSLLIASIDGAPACMVRFDTLSPGACELHINLNPALRGKRHGGPILAAACAYGFERLNFHTIDANIKVENLPSIKIFEGCGFVRQGEHAGMLTYKLARRRA